MKKVVDERNRLKNKKHNNFGSKKNALNANKNAVHFCEDGITLIALIVTIILLLILAGITIGLVAGKNGIIGKAKDTARMYKNAEAKEKVAMILQEYDMQKENDKIDGKNPKDYDDFLKEKEKNGDIDDYSLNEDGTPSKITTNGVTIPIENKQPQDPKIIDNENNNDPNNDDKKSGEETGTRTGDPVIYADSDGNQQVLTSSTPIGTKVGSSIIDGIIVDWYVFDFDTEKNLAYLISTPKYWEPDTTKEVSGAWIPKLVENDNKNTGGIRQAIQKKESGEKYSNYAYNAPTYIPSKKSYNYFKSINKKWSEKRGNRLFYDLNENEQAACYLADQDIFAELKEQANSNSNNGNLRGRFLKLVGGPSIEQYTAAYNKQTGVDKLEYDYVNDYDKNNGHGPGYNCNTTTKGSLSGDNIFIGNNYWLASPCYYGLSTVSEAVNSKIGGDPAFWPSSKLSLLATVSLGNTSYNPMNKGYYADVDDDGTVDGVVFIDLAQGASGYWNPAHNSFATSGVYSYSAVTSGLRSYKISTKTSSYTDKNFGTKPVIVANGKDGLDRFYVMALSDYDTSTHTWSDAYSKKIGNVTFRLPSKMEWAAFGGQFGITTSNYSSKYGLSNLYWSSTESDSSDAWCAIFVGGLMATNTRNNTYYVRLCATF